jgi:hypothetical protein
MAYLCLVPLRELEWRESAPRENHQDRQPASAPVAGRSSPPLPPPASRRHRSSSPTRRPARRRDCLGRSRPAAALSMLYPSSPGSRSPCPESGDRLCLRVGGLRLGHAPPSRGVLGPIGDGILRRRLESSQPTNSTYGENQSQSADEKLATIGGRAPVQCDRALGAPTRELRQRPLPMINRHAALRAIPGVIRGYQGDSSSKRPVVSPRLRLVLGFLDLDQGSPTRSDLLLDGQSFQIRTEDPGCFLLRRLCIWWRSACEVCEEAGKSVDCGDATGPMISRDPPMR